MQLDEGDAVDFLADVPHSYRNLGVVPAAIYLVDVLQNRPAAPMARLEKLALERNGSFIDFV